METVCLHQKQQIHLMSPREVGFETPNAARIAPRQLQSVLEGDISLNIAKLTVVWSLAGQCQFGERHELAARLFIRLPNSAAPYPLGDFGYNSG